MKIPPHTIDSWINAIPNTVFGALLYGPDQGLLSLRSQGLKRANLGKDIDPFALTEFAFDDIQKNPSLMHDAIMSTSLSATKRLIKVSQCGSALSKELSEVLDLVQYDDVFVIFQASDLSPSSKLRKYFEQASHMASLPCYKDDANQIKNLVSGRLKANKFSFTHDVVNALVERFFGDRLVILSELNKLMLYMGDEHYITMDHVDACIHDSQEISLENICQAIANKERKQANRYIHNAIQEGISAVAITRALVTYFFKIHKVLCKMQEGLNKDQAIKTLSPPLFFKHVAPFKQQLSLWDIASVTRMLSQLNQLEKHCKTTAYPAELICEHSLTFIERKRHGHS